MENNINIYMHGTDESGTPSNPEAPTSEVDPTSPEKKSKNKDSNFSGKAIGLYIAKQAFQMASSRVGQITRDSLLQERVNAIVKIGAYATAIAVNPVLGFLALGVDVANSSIDYAIKSSQEQSRLGILNERAGNINRSR